MEQIRAELRKLNNEELIDVIIELRQRLAHFTRKTLAFSKTQTNHEAILHCLVVDSILDKSLLTFMQLKRKPFNCIASFIDTM